MEEPKIAYFTTMFTNEKSDAQIRRTRADEAYLWLKKCRFEKEAEEKQKKFIEENTRTVLIEKFKLKKNYIKFI